MCIRDRHEHAEADCEAADAVGLHEKQREEQDDQRQQRFEQDPVSYTHLDVYKRQLLTLIILLFTLFLVEADSVGGLAVCLGVLVPSGWLFWKLIRVMGRIQVTRREQLPPA